MTDGCDIWAVVPIKEIDGAKSRLASKYNRNFRRGLARDVGAPSRNRRR